MRTHEEFEALIPIYALGGLASAEGAELEAHLQVCALCRQQYREAMTVVSLLARAAEPVEPSPEMRSRLFARVEADLARRATQARQKAPRRAWLTRPVWVWMALGMLILVAALAWFMTRPPSSREPSTIAEVLSDPKVRKIVLQPSRDAPGAWGEVYMVPGHWRAVLKVGGLKPLPPEQGYQFWFLRSGEEPYAADVFNVGPDGTNTLFVQAHEDVAHFNGWGVTIEPRSGVSKPTGPFIMWGSAP